MNALSILSGVIPPQDFSIEAIAGRLYYYEPQLQILYLNAPRIQERLLLQEFYNSLSQRKNDILESIVFYTEMPPKPFKIEQPRLIGSRELLEDICTWSYNAYEWCEEKHYCMTSKKLGEIYDEAEKTKYMLTLI